MTRLIKFPKPITIAGLLAGLALGPALLRAAPPVKPNGEVAGQGLVMILTILGIFGFALVAVGLVWFTIRRGRLLQRRAERKPIRYHDLDPTAFARPDVPPTELDAESDDASSTEAPR